MAKPEARCKNKPAPTLIQLQELEDRGITCQDCQHYPCSITHQCLCFGFTPNSPNPQ